MATEAKIEMIERVVQKLTGDVAFLLRHMADLNEIRESDKSTMIATAEGLDQLSDTLRETP